LLKSNKIDGFWIEMRVSVCLQNAFFGFGTDEAVTDCFRLDDWTWTKKK